MSKKRKAHTPEEGNGELNNSKAKKILRSKAQVTEDNEQKASVLTVQTNKCLSKAIAEETNQECKGNTKREKLVMDLNASKFLEDGTKASFQRKDKKFLPPSQGEKLVPVFKKPKKALAERRDRNSEGDTTVWTNQGQHIDRNIPGMTEGNIQNAVASSEKPCLSHRLETDVEDPEAKVILCEKPSEKLNVQMQDLDAIERLDTYAPKVELLDSTQGNQGQETESNLQTSICEKKMPEKTNSFFMCTPDNASMDDLEKRQLSLNSFACPVVNENSFMLTEERVIGCSKRSQNEEVYLSSVDLGIEQNKAIHIILGADDIKEVNQNEARLDVAPVECMPIGSQKQSNYVGTCSTAREESLDIRETDLFIPYKNEKTEDQNNICNSTDNFQCEDAKHSSSVGENNIFNNTENVEHRDPKHSSTTDKNNICNNTENVEYGDSKHSSTVDENNIFNNTENVEHRDSKHSSTTVEHNICNNTENFEYGDSKHNSTVDENNIFNNTENVEHGDSKDSFTVGENVIVQHTLKTNMKSVVQSSNRITEQNSPCKRETDVGKPHIVEGQGVSGKDSSTIQSVYKYLERETDFSEQNCKQIIATRNLLFPDPDGDIQSESRKNVMQEVTGTENKGKIKETEMRATLVKNTIDTLDPNVLSLPTEHKENSENLLSSVKQLEFNICDLTPSLEAKSEKGTPQQTLDNSPETKTIESVPFSTDVSFKEGIVRCEENKKKLESNLSSVDILPILVRINDTTGESKTDLEAHSTSPSKTASNSSVLSVLDTMAQISTSYTDTLALDLELLPDSELEGVFDKYNLDFSPHKDKIDQFDPGEQSRTKTPYPITDTTQSNTVRDEVNSDSAKQEDATDVVCGLIKELSNLNRMIMGMYRDLDSFKRLKLRRNRQPGKLLSHNINNITNAQCIGRKKREL